MKLKVTDSGVVIPREMLPDVDEVEVQMEGGALVLTPVKDASDPIWDMGSDPVTIELPEASGNPDQYLYQPDS